MAPQASQWLLTQNWAELSRYFQNRQPQSGDEYCLRALLNLHLGGGAPDWTSVIADLRQACALTPTDPLLSCNLTQALLDTQQTDLAYHAAEQTCAQYPNSLPAREKHVLVAVATQRWPQAYASLLHAKNLLGDKQQMPAWAADLLAELSPQWWLPLEAGGVVLRRPDASDAPFLKATFGNTAFMEHYHRFQGAGDEAVASFIAQANRSPRHTGRMDWIILDRNQTRVGLLAFVDIDWRNDRGELLIGIPGTPAPTVALKAAVAAIEFAFKRMGLQKIVSYVYADNPEAQANTLHLGFVQDGLLRSHISTASGRLDIFVNSLTPADLASNGLIQGLARKWMQKRSFEPEANALAHASQAADAHFGMGGNIKALVTFTPQNAGAYYLGVQR